MVYTFDSEIYSNLETILKNYVEQFNLLDNDLYSQYIQNKDAFTFLKNNIPLFEFPDKVIFTLY
jgi:hypothetical protein